ncbi:NanoRNase/pAp phosphatase [Maioricimonas rarisocia]|uniref:NanoRNase/pAp phosphatase n=1 Tax=Maioricimonas rarisocia TaxID=2528026 RepID=A0A517Z9X0_9PLAN|nr:bifunctional oligoribonuclease/PAP phosphatase NrnA [Maioricimonas rarisocia]QDU39285.1 NanoRNase/pAp phosphatase [Maioricimonas rarisocia]
MTVDWGPLAEIIVENERFVITSHVRPDADALGSELGLARILDRLGKQVRIVNPSATPDHLKFLDPEGRAVKLRNGVTIEQALDTDVHLIVDTSAWQQIADVDAVFRKTTARKVVIDHHVSSDDLGALEFKDTTASATGVLITELAEALGVELTEHEAVPLYAAIATDTGWFRFSNTEGRTMRTAARLIDCGVRPNLVYQQLYERSSLSRLKLHGCVLSRVAVEFDGRLAHTFVLQADFRQTGAHPSDTEDLVNDCLTIDGVACAFILVEQRNGQIKASLRSRTGVDVAAIAELFGGGGHRQASGAMLPGPLATAQTRILQAMHAALQEPAG